MKLPESIRKNLKDIGDSILYNDYELEDEDYKLTRKEKKLLKRQEISEAKNEKKEAKKQKETKKQKEPKVKEIKSTEKRENLDGINNIEEVDNRSKKEKSLKSEEKSQKRKLRIERKVNKNYNKYVNKIQKSRTLLEKLELIKKKLEKEELTPWRRLILQIKFSKIQTKLDKKIAYIDVEEFKQQCRSSKHDIGVNDEQKLNDSLEEYNEILDEQYEIENQLQDLTGTYQYQTKPENLVDIEEMNQQLEETIKRKEEKEQQMKEVFQEGQKRYDEIAKTMSKEIIRNNAVTIQWKTIKKFFKRIAKNVTDWWQNKKIEKDAKKGLSKEEKKNSKMEIRRSTANMRNAENETIVENFRKRLHYNTLQDEPEENLQEELGEPQEEPEQEELQENEISPILKQYIEESAIDGFDKKEFVNRIASANNTYSWKEKIRGMKEIDRYEQEKKSKQINTLGQIEEGMDKAEHYNEEHNKQQEDLSEEEIRRQEEQKKLEDAYKVVHSRQNDARERKRRKEEAESRGKKIIYQWQNNNYVPVEVDIPKEKIEEESVSKNQNMQQNIAKVEETETKKPTKEEVATQAQEQPLTKREEFVQKVKDESIVQRYIQEKRENPECNPEKFILQTISENNNYTEEDIKKAMQEIDLIEQPKSKNSILKMDKRQYEQEMHDINELMSKIKGSANLTGIEKLKVIKEINEYMEQQRMSQEKNQEKEQKGIEKPVVQEEILTQREKLMQQNEMNPILKQYIEESVKEGFDKNEFMDRVRGSAKLTGIEKLKAIKAINEHIEQQRMSQEKNQEQEKEQEEIDR